MARPDLRLQRLGDDKQILLDVKYRTGGQERANPDDVYKMLAYMNDFKVIVGGIIYPAATLTPKVIDDNKGQRLLEIPLRPPLPTTESAFTAQLRAFILSQFAN
jgi:5-methylcytosine-specific restriction endonuclease McrBC regulatory subunit McrC